MLRDSLGGMFAAIFWGILWSLPIKKRLVVFIVFIVLVAIAAPVLERLFDALA